MRCDCGKICDLLSTRLVVDTIEKEYYCLPCELKMLVTKDKRGNYKKQTFYKDGAVELKWQIDQ